MYWCVFEWTALYDDDTNEFFFGKRYWPICKQQYNEQLGWQQQHHQQALYMRQLILRYLVKFCQTFRYWLHTNQFVIKKKTWVKYSNDFQLETEQISFSLVKIVFIRWIYGKFRTASNFKYTVFGGVSIKLNGMLEDIIPLV